MSKLSDNVCNEDRIKVIKVCGQYLGGIWKTNEMVIKRFAQGYFNRIYYCELKTSENCMNDNNRKAVVVKLAQEEEFFLYSPFTSRVNTLVTSGEGLAPKVLGVFDGGLIQEYISCRSYNYSDDFNPTIITLLGQKLAKFHNIKSPIARDGSYRWMDRVFTDFLNARLYEYLDVITDFINKSSFETLKRMDFKDQLIWVRNAILSTDKILVFSHCDFNRGNILVKQLDQSFEIFFVDFDFTSNNFRGIDFGRYFSSWKQKEPNFGFGEYPTDQQMSVFIDAYIEESNRLTGNQFSKCDMNSKQHLIKESKLYTLVGVLIDVLFCIFKASVEGNDIQDFLAKGERRYSYFLYLKKKFQNENCLPKGFN